MNALEECMRDNDRLPILWSRPKLLLSKVHVSREALSELGEYAGSWMGRIEHHNTTEHGIPYTVVFFGNVHQKVSFWDLFLKNKEKGLAEGIADLDTHKDWTLSPIVKGRCKRMYFVL